MATAHEKRSQIAALTEKIDDARLESGVKERELVGLRSRVAKLEKAGVLEKLTAEAEAAEASLAESHRRLDALNRDLAEVQRKLVAAAPARAFVEAIRAAL